MAHMVPNEWPRERRHSPNVWPQSQGRIPRDQCNAPPRWGRTLSRLSGNWARLGPVRDGTRSSHRDPIFLDLLNPMNGSRSIAFHRVPLDDDGRFVAPAREGHADTENQS